MFVKSLVRFVGEINIVIVSRRAHKTKELQENGVGGFEGYRIIICLRRVDTEKSYQIRRVSVGTYGLQGKPRGRRTG